MLKFSEILYLLGNGDIAFYVVLSFKTGINNHKRRCPHFYMPWELVIAVIFKNDARAFEFEKYLKTASGRAFSKKHFL
jgi:hypothetical protein